MFRLTRRRGKERDCQQDADNGDDPASSSSATRNFPPADSADPCSPARVSRRVTTPFFELLEREVERKGFPSSLSSSLVSFGGSSTIFPAFHYHLFSFLAGEAFENNDRGGRGFFCPAHERARRKFERGYGDTRESKTRFNRVLLRIDAISRGNQGLKTVQGLTFATLSIRMVEGILGDSFEKRRVV